MQESNEVHIENNQGDDGFLNRVKYFAYGILFVAIVFSSILLFLEVTRAPAENTYDLAKIGAWGDTLGGLLNPIFSFLALLGLLWTIRLQSKELTLSRKELELSRDELKGSRAANEKLASAADQQNIENAFFQLLNLLQENLQTIRVSGGSDILIGARAFECFHAQLKQTLSVSISERPQHDQWAGGDLDDWEDDPLIGWPEMLKAYPNALTAKREKLVGAFKYVYGQNQADLGRYFRLLFNVLRFLSKKRGALPEDLYETYFKVVRASLSNYELAIIMANCLTVDGSEMKVFVSEFQLFDNLPNNLFHVDYVDEHGNVRDTIDFFELRVDFGEEAFGDIIGERLN